MTKKLKQNFFTSTKALLALGMLMLVGCSSFLYYPQKHLIFDPKKVGLTPEVVYFQNKEKQKLHAWWFPAKTKKPLGTFVYFHGNAENLSSHFASMRWLPDAGYNYFIFDYPGYGASEGEPDPYVNVMSGIAALEWVHENKDKSPLIIYGQSMGGIVAMRSAIEVKDRLPIRAVVVDGTFSSFQRIARKKLGGFWLTWLFQPLAYVVLSDRWTPDVEKISPLPLIVLHGAKDTVIPIEYGERIFKEAKEPKTWIPVPEGAHGDLFWVAENKYRKTLLDLLK